MKSQVTDIEHLSKTRQTFPNELSFAGLGLKLMTAEDVKDICDAIIKHKDLKVLRLEGNTIAPKAAEELAKALEKKKIQRLIGNDLFTGRLKDEIPLALRSMCGAISSAGSNLVEINMSDNAFGPIGLDALMEFFQSECCYSLKELRLHNNGLGPQGAQKFAHALEQGWRKSGKKMALEVFVCGRNRLEYEGAKSISNTLKLMGTLKEIQMPQNGIRPNAIEFVAEACAYNQSLRTINMNDNTFRSVGAEHMAKALCKLNDLEYINFGDCLLKSRGSLVLTRALVQSPKIKEIILSFNEISLDNGIEIAKLVSKKMNNLQLFDLNGNKFGEEGILEIQNILKNIGPALLTLSEDEGTDDEDEDQSDVGEEEDSGDEEENSEVIVDGEEDYDELEDYEEYDDDEDYEDDEDEEYEEEDYGSSDIVQPVQPSLFTPFNNNTIKPAHAINTKPNPFTAIASNKYLKTNTVITFDNFINSQNLENLKQIDEKILKSVSELEQFNGKFVILFLNVISKFYENNSKDVVLKCAREILTTYFKKPESQFDFTNDFLTQFGVLKSEEKNFHALDISNNLAQLLETLSKENCLPKALKQSTSDYIKLRLKANGFDQKFKNNSQLLLKCLA